MVFHSKSGQKLKPSLEGSHEQKKTSRTGGRTGNKDENDNLPYVHEEIAPGMVAYEHNVSSDKAKHFFGFHFAGIIAEGFVTDL